MKSANKLLAPKVLVPVILLIVLAMLPLFTRNNYVFQVGAVTLLYVYFALSWNVMGGLVGSWPMGSGVFIGVGAYCCAIVESVGGNALQSIPWAIGISLLLAFCIGKVCFRLSGTYFSLSTVAVLFIARYIMVSNNKFLGFETRAGIGMNLKWRGTWQYLQSTNKAFFYLLFLALVVVALIVTLVIMKSKMGYYFTSIKTNPGAAATIGVPVNRYKMYGFLISAAMLSIGGVMFCSFNMMCDPYVVLGYDMSLQIMMFVIIGGIGTLWGPVIGATVLMLFKEICRVQLGATYGQLAQVFFGVMLIVCIMFAPKGLYGLFTDLVVKLKQRKATEIAKEAAANE